MEIVCREAAEDAELVKGAPYNAPVHQLAHPEELDDPEKWALTWRAYKRKFGLK